MTKLRFWIPLCLLTVLWAPLTTSVTNAQTSPTVFINEIHYDNAGADSGEFIEIAGPAGTDLSAYSIVRYNGSGGAPYTTPAGPGPLTGTIPDQQNGFGTLAFSYPADGLQNGSPDGIALVQGTTVIQFLSYEGAFTAVGGAAHGTTSTDIGVAELGTTPVGFSLQLQGTGTTYNQFTWALPAERTFGTVNTGQTFTGGATVSIDDVAVTEGDAGQMLATFTVTVTGDHGGITFDIAAADGAGANAATIANNDFIAAAAVGSITTGETEFSFSVPVLGDTTFEPNENFSVVLSNVTGAGVAKGTGIGSIVNDDPAPPVVSDVVISQVYGGGGNTGAPLSNDFIELFNRSSSPVNLEGWSVQYSSATGSGMWAVTPLSGTIAPGRYYLIQQAAGANVVAPLPTPDAMGSIAMGSTSGKVALQMNITPIVGACPLANTADLVGYGVTATCSETAPIDPATTNSAAALRKRGGCFDSNHNDVDFSIAPPSPRNSLSPPNSCTPLTLAISQIQGATTVTPYAGQLVTTTGIVSAVKSNGFFLQAPAPGDNDAATSDGLFVFTQATPAVAVGHAVSVTGTASEFFQLTQIEASLPGDVVVQSAGNAVPDAIALTTAILDPTGPVDQLEPLEGMRVSAASLTSVAPTNEFGEIDTVLTGVARPMREPGISVLAPVPVDPSSGTVDCCIPRFDENPERIMVDSDGLGLPVLAVTSHVLLANVAGPLDFAFGRYKIALESTPATSPNISGIPVPAPLPREFTIGGYNIENFTGGEPQLTKASLAIRQLMRSPDVIGHIEILDQPSLQNLANRVNADTVAAGLPDPMYQAVLIPFDPPGDAVNTQNVGFLVKTSRVRIDAFTQELAGETFIDPTDGSTDTLHDRPPLVLRATFDYNGANPTPGIVVVNHLRSFIDIELLGGAGPRVRAKRTLQAESVARLLQQLQADNPGVPVVSIGDYNAYQFNDGYTDPIAVLKGQPTPDEQIVVDASPDLVEPNYVNLTDSLPASERYSFIFEGTPQALDHALVNTVAAQYVRRYAIARGNADFPEVPAALYAADTTRPERSSDHDMPVAYFLFPDVTPPVISNVPGDITLDAAGPDGTVVTFATPTAEDNTDGALPVTCTPASGSLFPIGATLVTCTATDASGNSAAVTFTVTIVDPQTPGVMSGGGVVESGATRLTFSFEVTESGFEGGYIVSTVRHTARPNHVQSLSVEDVFFFADGSVVFSGPATFNGISGFTFEARAADNGEPGRNDTFSLIVRDADGVAVVNVGGTLAGGNIQSRPVR